MRRTLAAALVALPYLAASYFAQAAFKETAEALFVLAFALACRDPARAAGGHAGARCASPCPCLALAGGDLLLLQLRRPRLAARDPRPLEPDPAGGAAGAARRARCCASCCGRRPWSRSLVLAGLGGRC